MRASLHLLGLAHLAACGGRTALSTPDAGGWTVPDAAGADAATVAPLRCTLGVQPSAPDPRELAQGALCRFDGTATRPGAIVLAAIDGDALYGIDARGVARMVHRFAEGLPFAAEPGRAVLTARGEHIAGAMTWIETPASGGGRVAFERVLARRDGVVLHRALEVLPYFAGGNELRVQGNECGVFAWGWGSGLRKRMDLATADGALIEPQEAYLPRADPDGDGVLAVSDVTGGRERVWWLDPRALTFTPTQYESGRFRSSLHSLGSDLVYATGWLVGTVTLERPGGAVQRFPSEHLRGVQEAHIAATARNGWVFALGRGGDHAVINVRSGERRDIAFAVPQGMRRVHLPGVERGPDDAWDISITTGGELVMALRDNTFGRVHRSRDGSTWSAYEPAFGDVESVRVMEHNGTVLAFALGLRRIPTDWWRPLGGATRYDGRNVFVARGEGRPLPRSSRTWEGEPYHLSDDGGCLAYWTASGPAALRVAAGSSREFVLGAATTEPRLVRAMTWALGDGAVLTATPE